MGGIKEIIAGVASSFLLPKPDKKDSDQTS